MVVISTSDNSIAAVVGIQYWSPVDLCITPAGDYVYVISSMAHILTVIETSGNTVVAEIDVELDPNHICAHPTAEYLYLTHGNSSTVSVIRTSDNQVVECFTTGDHQPDCICALPSGEAFYMSSWSTDMITVIR
jgi:YVTN family beta-propeller protein